MAVVTQQRHQYCWKRRPEALDLHLERKQDWFDERCWIAEQIPRKTAEAPPISRIPAACR